MAKKKANKQEQEHRPTVYGYVRTSTKRQLLSRQITNIKAEYPDIDEQKEIYKDQYTGTKVQGRKAFEALLEKVQPGDTIVFDSVSRMSRNAAEGSALYMDLMNKGITLVFLKEPQINTDTYKQALNQVIPLTNSKVDRILGAINDYLRELATRQIELAFEQAEKEAENIRKNTKDGIREARSRGQQIGHAPGTKLIKESKLPALLTIIRYSNSFNGTMPDEQCARAAGISRSTLNRYRDDLMTRYDGRDIMNAYNQIKAEIDEMKRQKAERQKAKKQNTK